MATGKPADSEGARNGSYDVLPEGTIEKNRACGYSAVLLRGRPGKTMVHIAGWLALLSFFITPQGLWCFYFSVKLCSGFADLEAAFEYPVRAVVIGSIITASLSILTFVPFARLYDQIYKNNPDLRCQPGKTHNVDGFARSEVMLAISSLCLAAVLSAGVCLIAVRWPGWVLVHANPISTPFDALELLVSTVLYFLWIDLWAYVGHRLLHLPFLYRTVHKWHHAYRQPTAFVALGLHPFDMLLIQGGVFVGLFFVRMHVAALVANLLYVHYHNVVDHSGVYFESWLPWQPSSLYHDDHHKLFHVNYGQTLTIWDRLGGTFYSTRKKYSEGSFSW